MDLSSALKIFNTHSVPNDIVVNVHTVLRAMSTDVHELADDTTVKMYFHSKRKYSYDLSLHTLKSYQDGFTYWMYREALAILGVLDTHNYSVNIVESPIHTRTTKGVPTTSDLIDVAITKLELDGSTIVRNYPSDYTSDNTRHWLAQAYSILSSLNSQMVRELTTKEGISRVRDTVVRILKVGIAITEVLSCNRTTLHLDRHGNDNYQITPIHGIDILADELLSLGGISTFNMVATGGDIKVLPAMMNREVAVTNNMKHTLIALLSVRRRIEDVAREALP